MSQIQPSPKAHDLARQVLRIEADAVLALIDRIVERRDLRETLAALLALHNAGNTQTAGQGVRR